MSNCDIWTLFFQDLVDYKQPIAQLCSRKRYKIADCFYHKSLVTQQCLAILKSSLMGLPSHFPKWLFHLYNLPNPLHCEIVFLVYSSLGKWKQSSKSTLNFSPPNLARYTHLYPFSMLPLWLTGGGSCPVQCQQSFTCVTDSILSYLLFVLHLCLFLLHHQFCPVC